jgi:hypothetical protein
MVRRRRDEEWRGSQSAEALPSWVEGLGAQHALDLIDGWLVGKDGGEWGGRLWWVPPNGKQEVLVKSNVVSLQRLSERSALAFTGVAHMWTDVGDVHRVTIENGAARVDLLGRLDGLAEAVGERGEDFLAATNSGVWLVSRTRAPVRLAAVDLALLIPRSIVEAADGAVYVGLNAFVLRLVPSASGFEAEWMLPPGCERIGLRDGSCVCTP